MDGKGKGHDELTTPEMMMSKGGFKEEDILRIHILWVGYAMCRVFQDGYNPNNLVTLHTAVDALHSFLIDKVEDDKFKNDKIKIQDNGIKNVFQVVRAAQNEQKGFQLYEDIVKKYRALIILAKKVHVEDSVSDPAW